MFARTPSAELERRMAQPQRHRLLQGYPMAPLLEPHAEPLPPLASLPRDEARPLLVGVLPHASCNPSVRGCGFCTFPHEPFEKSQVLRTVDAVCREVAHLTEQAPDLARREVHAVYLGGGTANLTPPEALSALLRQLATSFDLARAELTLEGVPRYFLVRDAASLDLLAQTEVRHRRISMGVQSFDPAWLARMGRAAFGDAALVAEVVQAAHARQMTASVDLLYNLPGQPIEHALADVRQAIEMGLDQICIYNLVLTADLGTQWSKDRSLLRATRAPAQGCETWRTLREELLARGYVQTTLTNFERGDLPLDQRFAYERCSFDPATFDAIGFGPAAISTFTTPDRQSALKWINRGNSRDYVLAMAPGPERMDATERSFRYTLEDLHLLHLTRNLSALSVDRARYLGFFGVDPIEWLAEIASTLERAGLIEVSAERLSLTPEGMFYADSVAGLMAWRRVSALRLEQDDREARKSSMG